MDGLVAAPAGRFEPPRRDTELVRVPGPRLPVVALALARQGYDAVGASAWSSAAAPAFDLAAPQPPRANRGGARDRRPDGFGLSLRNEQEALDRAGLEAVARARAPGDGAALRTRTPARTRLSGRRGHQDRAVTSHARAWCQGQPDVLRGRDGAPASSVTSRCVRPRRASCPGGAAGAAGSRTSPRFGRVYARGHTTGTATAGRGRAVHALRLRRSSRASPGEIIANPGLPESRWSGCGGEQNRRNSREQYRTLRRPFQVATLNRGTPGDRPRRCPVPVLGGDEVK